jgi:hypothetical protein
MRQPCCAHIACLGAQPTVYHRECGYSFFQRHLQVQAASYRAQQRMYASRTVGEVLSLLGLQSVGRSGRRGNRGSLQMAQSSAMQLKSLAVRGCLTIYDAILLVCCAVRLSELCPLLIFEQDEERSGALRRHCKMKLGHQPSSRSAHRSGVCAALWSPYPSEQLRRRSGTVDIIILAPALWACLL